MNKRNKIIAMIGVMAAFAAVLSYIEAMIAFSIWIPGVKLGLANIAVVIVLYLYGEKEALSVNVIRIIIVSLLFGNMFSMLYSLAGAAFSFIAMVLFKKMDCFSALGVSVAGGVFHNLGQAIVASFIVNTYSVMFYVPALIIAGIVTGIIIGIVSKAIIRYMTKYKLT